MRKNFELLSFFGALVFLFSLGISFWPLFLILIFFLVFGRDRESLWWLLALLGVFMVLIFRNFISVFLSVALLGFFSRFKFKNLDSVLILFFFVASFCLFSLQEIFPIWLPFWWFFFFLILFFLLSRLFFFREQTWLFELILAFVLSEFFVIASFLPFGPLALAGAISLLLLAFLAWQKDRSLKDSFFFIFLAILIFIFSGLKPR